MRNTYLFLPAIFLALTAPGLGAPNSPAISLKLALLEDSPKVGSEIRLRVTLTNVTQHPITIAAGWAEQLYRVDLRDDSGKPVAKKQYFKFGSLWNIDIQPGATQQDNLELSHMYILTRSGTYVVQVSRKSGHEPGVGTEDAKSNVLIINIEPKETTDNAK